MGINWKELELLLSELPLKDSYIQKITEHDFHSFTLHMFSREEKSWLLYIEIATANSRICRTDKIREKSRKNQRFVQYLKAHLIGKRITGVRQLPYDRAFILQLKSQDEELFMTVRLFSGPSANIIITDKNFKILELMFRRPERGECEGNILSYEERTDEGMRHFSVREYSGASFNEFIDKSFDKAEYNEKKDDTLRRLIEKRDKEISELQERLRKQKEKAETSSHYDEDRRLADLLQSNIYLVRKGMDRADLTDWSDGSAVSIALDPALSPNENLDKLYQRYRKNKKAYELSIEEIKKIEKSISDMTTYYNELLKDDTPLSKLKKAAAEEEKRPSHIREGKPGLYAESNGWTLIIGRNAKENDAILRSEARGNDIWLHTRDFAGGYIIIRSRNGKTVPLPVLLDAASLAIHFSKARSSNKADLYYTEVKYLKRIKGAKTGLIIPTQERNLHAEIDEERIRRLLG